MTVSAVALQASPVQLSPEEESLAVAVRHGAATGVVLLDSLRLYAITGKDAARFLHNRTTHDVMALQAGDGQWNAVLDKSAHVLGYFWLGRPAVEETNPAFWLVVEEAIAEQTVAALLQYKIMEDVAITPQSQWGCVALCGVNALSVFGTMVSLPSDSFPLLGCTPFQWEEARGVAIRTTVTGEDTTWVCLPTEVMESFVDATQKLASDSMPIQRLTSSVYEVLCLEAGTLRAGRDYDATTLLPETGLEQGCVSYTKGCYLGQETVARVKTYGSVPKAMVGLVLPKGNVGISLQALPVDITIAEEASSIGRLIIGHLTTVQYSPSLQRLVGLAYLSKAYRIPGKTLALSLNTPSGSIAIEATVTLLPFVGESYKDEQAKQYLNQGLTAFANDENSEATALLRQAVALAPSNPDALEALCAVLTRQQHYDDALALALRLVEVDPNRVMGYTNLSVCYMQLGDKEKAEDAKAQATLVAFRKAMGGKPPVAEAASSASKELGKSEAVQPQPEFTLTPKQRTALEEKVALFRSALQHSPNDPLGNFGLGCALLDLGHAQEAIEALSKTVGLKTSQSTAYTKLGQAYELLQDWENARSTYAQGIEVASVRRDLMALKTLQDRLDALNET